MKTLLTALGCTIAFTAATPAYAYCCKTHPAICEAACGQRCCSKPDRLSAGGNCGGSMSKIPVANLKAELVSADKTDAAFAKLIRAELERRTVNASDRRRSN